MRDPRSVRRRVSGAMPTVKECGVKVTTVRQTPLMAMLSPSWQSERRVEVEGMVIVRDVPPVLSLGLSSDTTRSECVSEVSQGSEFEWLASNVFYYAGEHVDYLSRTAY